MHTRFKKFLVEHRWLVLILVVSGILRFYRLTDTPPALNWDEVSHGYNAYSIIKTGRDEWGEIFPAIFRAYGDYKLPVYIYTTAVSVYALGLNALAVRLPSVIAGILSVYFTYKLAKELFSGKKYKYLPVVAALLVAVEPWSLFLSRGAFEANLSLALIVSGVYFFVRGVKKPEVLPYSVLLFGISVWTYNSARVFVPLFVLFLIYLYKLDLYKNFSKYKRYFLAALLILVLFLKPMFVQLTSSEGQARHGKVAILDSGAIEEINQARNTSSLSPFLSRVAHNKATKFASEFARNWTKHYSGDYLFFEGGSHFQFSIPGRGLIYYLNAPFLLLGVFLLLKERSRRSLLILGWFFFGSIPSAITAEAPHVLRSITMLPAPMIITAYGLVKFITFLENKYLKIGNWKLKISSRTISVIYLAILGLFLVNYLSMYFGKYREEYSWSWQYGYEQVVDYAKENYELYDKIVITKKYGEPHEFFLFFWPWEPSDYINDPELIRFGQSDWFWVDRFDKFYFVNDWQINEEGTGNYMFNLESGGVVDCLRGVYNCLLVTSPGNVPDWWVQEHNGTVNFLSGSPAFEMYSNTLVR